MANPSMGNSRGVRYHLMRSILPVAQLSPHRVPARVEVSLFALFFRCLGKSNPSAVKGIVQNLKGLLKSQ